MWNSITQHIREVTGVPFEIQQRRSVSGGCINQGYAISHRDRTYFVKLNQAPQVEMFAAEALGLQQMKATQTIRVPEPVCWGSSDGHSYLVMEWLEFGRSDHQASEQMGRNLAAMHRQGRGEAFGWERNNTIGSTPQLNPWTDNWAEFFAQHRIGHQLKLAQRRGGSFPERDRVVAAIQERLADTDPQPALVHGDLWSGNAAVTTQGEPVILDPATYYGDREVDMAMTELFGGFPAGFYRGYNETWPLEAGYGQRKAIYNLYHILNHFNLFGGGYGDQARTMIEQLL